MEAQLYDSFFLLESSHGTIVPRKFVELSGSKWNYKELIFHVTNHSLLHGILVPNSSIYFRLVPPSSANFLGTTVL